MNFWKQIPASTKIYLIILVYLSFMLLFLILTRNAISLSEGLSLKGFFARNGESETATASYEASTAFSTNPASTSAPNAPRIEALEAIDVYDGPGNRFNKIAILEKGQFTEVIGANSDRSWLMVVIPYVGSDEGWVSSNNVKIENIDNITTTPIEEETAISQTSPEDIPSARAFMNVNIRSGPDLTFEKIGLLKNGDSAEVVGISQDGLWLVIKLPGGDNVGWISKDYVILTNTEGVPVTRISGITQERIPPTPAPGSPSLTANYPVNIRAGPGIEFAVVGQMAQGQTAEVVGINRDGLWIAIKLLSQQNGVGWVAAAYVRLTNASNVPILK